MDDEKTMLEVGDWIYNKRNDRWVGRMKVTRVTKNGAFVALNDTYEARFKREINSYGDVDPVPSEKWRQNFYYVETEEIKASYNAALYVSRCNAKLEKIKEIDKSSFSTDKAKELLDELTKLEEKIMNDLNKNI